MQTLPANAIVVLLPITRPRGLGILEFTPTSTMQCLLVFCSDNWSPRNKRKPSQCIRLCYTRTNAVCSAIMHGAIINVRVRSDHEVLSRLGGHTAGMVSIQPVVQPVFKQTRYLTQELG
jgi:hypothetical protein